MKSRGYRKCRTCEASVPPHKIYCRPCADRRHDEREAKYRKAKQEKKKRRTIDRVNPGAAIAEPSTVAANTYDGGSARPNRELDSPDRGLDHRPHPHVEPIKPHARRIVPT